MKNKFIVSFIAISFASFGQVETTELEAKTPEVIFVKEIKSSPVEIMSIPLQNEIKNEQINPILIEKRKREELHTESEIK